MAKFSAGHVEPLDYDFTTARRADADGYCSGKGTVPEPSRKDLDEFLGAMGTARAAGLSLEEPDASDEAWNDLLKSLEKFCKGHPTREQLEELPVRALMAFVQWLVGEFNNPEVSRAGIRR